MSILLSLKAEVLKTKRTASLWMSLLGATFIPGLFMLIYLFNTKKILPRLREHPWEQHFLNGWQSLSTFLFPMYIILVCALIPQIEFRNNTWKQVYSSPQTNAEIYLSKLITVHIMILLFYTTFVLFMILGGIATNTIFPEFTFFDNSINWKQLMRLNLKTYISILGISGIQFWLSLRFKSFVGPVGIGLALLVAALIARGFGWEHLYLIPYAHPILTLQSMFKPASALIDSHEWISILYFIIFIIIGFIDLTLRKEKG